MEKEVVECYRVSPQQEQLLAQRHGANQLTYCAQCVILIQGAVFRDSLKAALRNVVAWHEILRTKFQSVPETDSLRQVIVEEEALSWEEYDFSNVGGREQQEKLDALASEIRQSPFDLRVGAVVRASFVALSPGEQALVLTLPALCADQATLKILVYELERAYVSQTRGGVPQTEPVQYSDVSDIFNELLEAEDSEPGRAYWREYDLSALHALNAPLERRTRPDFDPKQLTLTIGMGASERLMELASRYRTDASNLLLACWQALLWRLNKQENVIVGREYDGRNHEELEHALGLFSKYLPVRVELRDGITFAEVLGQVGELSLEAQDWQDYFAWRYMPGDANGTDAPRFFPYCFEFEVRCANEARADVSFAIQSQHVCFDRYKIKLSAWRTDNLLGAELHYDASLYGEDDLRRLAGQFTNLLERVTLIPELPIDEIQITTEEELSLFNQWNQTFRDYPRDKRMHDLFEEQAARTPDSIALIFGEQRLSYRELNAGANQLAHYLRDLGVDREVRVGVLMERSPQMLVSLLAVLKAGGAYVPLDPAYPGERLSFIIEDSRAKLLLAQEGLARQLPACSPEVVCVDERREVIARRPDCNLRPSAGGDNLAYLIYTSGSTGRPKGVAIEHHSASTFLHWAGEVFGSERLKGVLASTSICFDLSVFEIFAPLSWGGKVILAADALALPELAAAVEVTLVNTVPSAMAELVRVGGVPAGVRTINLAGEPLPNNLAQESYSFENVEQVLNLYGPSEDTTYSTFGPVRKGGTETPSIGRPIANTRVYVLDERMQLSPIGVAGELHLGGEGLARGYLNQPHLTAEKFFPDPFSTAPGARLYRTGDMVRWLPAGELEFIGRVDQQVKLRGYRIELGEIESCLRSHPAVAEAVVIAREDSPGQRRLVGYYVCRGVETATASQLREHARGVLPEYMAPAALMQLARLPLTPNGKVDRRALPVPGATAYSSTEYVAPQRPAEHLLVSVWQELLGAERVGVNDNFFELGGHSLLATQVTSRLRQVFPVELTVRDLFEHQTVAELARRITEIQSDPTKTASPPLLPAQHSGELPLSFAQQRLWFTDQLEPGSPVYNLPAAVRLEGRLDIDALTRTLTEIVRRHEALRTSFPTVSGRPAQLIHPARPFDLPLLDLSHLPEREREQRAKEVSAEEAKRPFDLFEGPLLRSQLLRLSAAEHILVVVMHHIISDGWSMGVLVREVAALYTAFANHQASPLPQLPLQYGDYALWQRSWLSGAALERQLAYWRERLEGVGVLQLPTDRERPVQPSYEGASWQFTLEEELSEQLRALSRGAGATLFMTLLAGFEVLLWRYSSQEQFVVGTPIANRTRAELEGLIGFFVNTLALRADLSGEPTFRELLARVREASLGAYAHQDVPFEQLVEQLQPERDLGRNPLFQVMFALQNVPLTALELPGLTIRAAEAEAEASFFDLGLTLAETGGRLTGTLSYRRELFEEASIERMAGHYQQLLRAAVRWPDGQVGELEMLAEEERRQLHRWSQGRVVKGEQRSVLELFAEQAELRAERLAVVDGERRVTYGELMAGAKRVARRLREVGVEREARVGVLVGRKVEMVESLLGVWEAGGVYVPLEWQYPAQRLGMMMEDAGVWVLVAERGLYEEIGLRHAGPVVLMGEEWRESGQGEGACEEAGSEEAAGEEAGCVGAGSEEAAEDAAIDGENAAYVIYTSGSSGLPKGVLVTHKGIANAIVNAIDIFEVQPESRVLQVASQSFDAALKEIFLALATGAALHIATEEQRRSGQELADLIRREAITTAVLTPSTLKMLEASEVPTLKVVSTGGEKCSREVANDWNKERRLLNCYGPTETAVFVTYADCSGEFSHDPPIGRPIANTEVYILDGQGRPVPAGVIGELYVGGSGLARGYLGRPALTAERFVPHPLSREAGARLYRTGDLGRYLPDGQIEYYGRRDEQVKVRGFRIELGEIETKLRQHPDVQDAAVVVLGEGETKSLVAYVVGRGAASLEASDLRLHLKQHLPEYMMPSAFVMLASMPQTRSGKLDKTALPAPGEIISTSASAHVSPRDRMEVQLLRLWENLLNVRNISVTDNFFEIGGHSLLAVQLAAQIKEDLGIEFPLTSIFPDINIERQARILRERSVPTKTSSLIGLQTTGAKTPFFCVHPALGLSICYLPLASNLDADRPFYGFHAPGMDDESEPLTDPRQMAALYIEELRTVQAEGPYLLGGYSVGGSVAYEMAQQLRSMGQEVGMLAMLDAGVLYNEDFAESLRQQEDDDVDIIEGALRDFCSFPTDSLRQLEPEERLPYALEQLKREGLLLPDFKVEQLGRWLKVYKAISRAWMVEYQPQPYPGEVVVLRSEADPADSDADPTLGWGRLAAGGVRILDTPGDHLTIIREPHVKALASRLRALLDEVDAGHQGLNLKPTL